MLFAFLQDEEEGALRTRYCSVKGEGETRGLPNVNKEYYSFLAPSNKPISVSKTVTELRFSEIFECNIEDNYADRLQSPDYNVDISTNQKLTSFKIGETQYKARINNNFFEGYYAIKDNDFGFPVKIPSGEQYEDTYTPKNSSVEVYLPESTASFTVCPATFEAKAPYYADGDITGSEVPCSQDYNTTVESFASLLEGMIKEGNYIQQTWKFLDETTEKVYKDKFSVFKSETGGKSIYVLSHPISFNMPESQKSEFAKAVTEKCSSFDKQKMLLLCIPYYFPYEYQVNRIVPDRKLVAVQGYKTDFSNSSGNDFIAEFYKQVPKPYKLYSYYLSYTGEVTEFNPQKSASYITGHDCIYDFVLGVDPRMGRYISLLKDFERLRNSVTNTNPINGQVTVTSNNPYAAQDMARISDELASFETKNPEGETKTINHGLFESKLGQKISGKEFSKNAQQFAFWYRDDMFRDIERTGYGRTNSPANENFIIGKNQVLYDRTLSNIDAIGLLLMPVGLDFIGDGIGFLYAGYYKDYPNVGIYAAVLAVPIGTAAIYKGLAKGTKRLVRVGDEFRIVDNIVHIADDFASYAGKITKEGKNLLNLESPVSYFRQLKHTNGATYRAANFWTDNSTDIVHYVSNDAKYYVKHDPTNGRMLFIDAENNKFMGFALDESGLVKGDYESLINNLKTIHGLPGGSKSINIKGTTINFADDKANLVLGKYNPNGTPGISGEIGTDDIINELTILKNYSFADKTFELRNGSVHVLNIPDGMYNPSTFFETYNKEILDLAVNNPTKVKVTLVSDPRKSDLLTLYRNGVKTKEPTGFAQEIRYLREKGITNVYLKDGSQLNLNTIDLDILEWSLWNY